MVTKYEIIFKQPVGEELRMDQPEVYLTICVNNYSEDTRQKVGLGQTTRDGVGLKI